MAARQATGDTTLARLVRERQDLAADWEAHDKLLISALSRSADQRDAISEKVQAGRRASITGRIAEIDSTLSKEFPDYAALASLKPLSIAELQSQLTHGEALALLLDTPKSKPTPEETFIWVVTKTEADGCAAILAPRLWASALPHSAAASIAPTGRTRAGGLRQLRLPGGARRHRSRIARGV